ncbi:MAG: SGNH/GDSL hydrolase family protein [Lentisphaerae bacterium]|nr:SGNH/GDSL hydrolase family protein [Lentisphaerota bacterium]MCP4101267.1 SGNH/GDSL hydrolase family protein [Lentisphaerota bacterium]
MDRIKNLMAEDRPLKWLFYGDSITHGADHCYGQKSYSEHFAERIRYEMRRFNDIIINSAISGDTTVQLLE